MAVESQGAGRSGVAVPATPTWRSWSYQVWSENLLEHYFGRGGEDVGPVSALNVSDAELAQVVDEPSALPADVREQLIDATVKAATSVGRGFWKHAESRTGMAKPFYLAHLTVACIAVTDASDADENSNIERIAHLTRGASGDHNLDVLPALWRSLQAWLEARPDDYRPLLVPDPGGWSRIGHTVRLAFPSRRDQQQLFECLHGAGLDMADPPLGPVLHAVAQRTNSFSERFRGEFDAFRAARSADRSLVELHGMPLWSAVRSAVAAAGASDARTSQQWALIAEDDGYDVELLLVTDRPTAKSIELDDGYGQWSHVVQNGNGDDAVAGLLQGRASYGSLGPIATGGILPFREETHGALELARRDQLDDVVISLVSERVLEEVLARFSGARTTFRSSSYASWVVMRGLRLETQPDESLDSSSLAKCWLLRRSPQARRILLSGGIAVGTDHVGLAALLPTIVATGARAVEFGREGGLEPLASVDGKWRLPATDLEGSFDLLVEYEDEVRLRELSFVSAPDSEDYRVIGRPESWVVESCARAVRLTLEGELDPDTPANISEAADRVYLGRDVGLFAGTAGESAWEITTFGDKTSLRCLVPESELDPIAQSANRGNRRRWRRLLSGTDDSGLDPSIAAKRRSIVARPDSHLPTFPAVTRPTVQPAEAVRTVAEVEQVVGAVAAISNRRQGLERQQLTGLFCDALGLDWSLARDVIRAWQENALIDELVNTRWSGRRIIARRPAVQLFEVDGAAMGTLNGLTLVSTRQELRVAAEQNDIEVIEIGSLSAYVPASLGFRCDSHDRLRRFAASQRIEVRNLRPNPFHVSKSRDLLTPEPGGYIDARQSLNIGDIVELRRWRRQGAPSHWTIVGPEHSTWTHFYDAAKFWGAAFAGAPSVKRIDDHRLHLANAHLPLTTARWLNAVGGLHSGPVADGSEYAYGSPSAQATDLVMTGLAGFIRSTFEALADSRRDPTHV